MCAYKYKGDKFAYVFLGHCRLLDELAAKSERGEATTINKHLASQPTKLMVRETIELRARDCVCDLRKAQSGLFASFVVVAGAASARDTVCH